MAGLIHSLQLQGRRILVVEDNYLLAYDLQHTLEEQGIEVIGPASNVTEALSLVDTAMPLDGAVLDVNLRGEKVFPVAETLKARNVPFVFSTGYDAWSLPDIYASTPLCQKPVDINCLRKALFE